LLAQALKLLISTGLDDLKRSVSDIVALHFIIVIDISGSMGAIDNED
jgi:hypothetical protein